MHKFLSYCQAPFLLLGFAETLFASLGAGYAVMFGKLVNCFRLFFKIAQEDATIQILCAATTIWYMARVLNDQSLKNGLF